MSTANRALLQSTGVAQTRALGRRLARFLRPGDVVLLQGPLATRLYHADLYRLTAPDEVEDLHLEDQARNGVLLIEWPERGLEVLPAEHLLIVIDPVEGKPKERRITIVASGARYERVLDGLGARG